MSIVPLAYFNKWMVGPTVQRVLLELQHSMLLPITALPVKVCVPFLLRIIKFKVQFFDRYSTLFQCFFFSILFSLVSGGPLIRYSAIGRV